MIPRKKLKTYLQTREDQVRVRWEEKQRGNSLQQTFTPFSLTYEMLKRLPSLEGKDVLVVANMETFYLLKYLKVDGYVSFNSVTLLTDIEELEGKDGVSYNSFDELDKVDLGMKFDVVIGNPPYSRRNSSKRGTPIYQHFVNKGYGLLKENGYMLMIHPSGWRWNQKTTSSIFNLLKDNNTIFLRLTSTKHGLEWFKVGTTCDYYLVQKRKSTNTTTVLDTDENTHLVDLSSFFRMIPDNITTKSTKVLATKEKDSLEILYNTAYHTQKSYITKEKKSNDSFPVISSISKNKGPNLYWSTINGKGHFGVPKIILTNGAGAYPILDLEGRYATTEFGFSILGSKDELKNIEKVLVKEEFIDLCKQLGVGNNKYAKHVLESLHKDFWKEFVD